MKTIFNLALAGIILLAGCNKSGVAPAATSSKANMNLNAKTNLSSTNGSAGITNVYYDGQLFMMNINPFNDQPASSLLANNKSINILYESNGFITVTNAIQGGGPGYNALWQEVDIVFNYGTPYQFTSDNDILPAASGPNPQITLVPTTKVYRCAIVQHTKPQ